MRAVTTQSPATSAKVRARHAPSTLRIEAGTLGPTTDTSPHRRTLLEHELDRVQGALQSEQTRHGQQLNWLMLSQALLVNAYLIVLVLGWSTPLPAKRWLLMGLALFGAALAVLIFLALRGSRDATQLLRQRRKDLEATLHKDFRRTPVFVTPGIFARGASASAVRLLPLTFIAGWIGITLYTLGAPVLQSTELQAVSPPARSVAPGEVVPARATRLTPAANAEFNREASTQLEAGANANGATALPRPGIKW